MAIASEYSLAADDDNRAHEIAAKVRAYWTAHGHKVEVRLVRENGYLVVRSNLVNGWPR
jgi:hypothetical protein